MRIRWAGYVAGMERIKIAYKNLVGNLKERNYVGALDTDWRSILKQIFKNRI
jgi:hypothetical protein